MTKNFNILFYIRKDKANNQGQVPIYCRITVNGKRSELAIKRYTQESKWNSDGEHVRGNTEEVKSINTFIDTVRRKIQDHQHKLLENGDAITSEAIKNSFLGISHVTRSLFTIFEEHNSQVRSLVNQDFAAGTLERYETVLRHLKEFVSSKYHLTDFLLKDVDYEFIQGFDYYLRSARHCENNTTVKYLKNFKKIIRIGLANGWITIDPFLNYKVKLRKVDRGFLTQKELDTITEKEFSTPRLNQIKDAFLFQCYTGLAYADIKSLKRVQLIKDADGELWISTHRMKTDTPVNVPVLPQAMEIIERYKDHPECCSKGLLLPVLSNQKMNAYLKEIADVCGIQKNISSHLARHTFATTVTLANGTSLEAVSKMLGHTNLNTSRIYARMLDSRVSDEMKVLKNRYHLKVVKAG